MDINELIAIIKKKLQSQIDIESINIEDKTFLHKKPSKNIKGLFVYSISNKSPSSSPFSPQPAPGGDCDCDFFGFRII